MGDYKKIIPHASGKSLLMDKKFFSDYYHSGILGWIEGDNLIEYNTQTSSLACYDIAKIKQKKRDCSKEDFLAEKRALAFSIVSQTLLFKGETLNFDKYRYFKDSK